MSTSKYGLNYVRLRQISAASRPGWNVQKAKATQIPRATILIRRTPSHSNVHYRGRQLENPRIGNRGQTSLMIQQQWHRSHLPANGEGRGRVRGEAGNRGWKGEMGGREGTRKNIQVRDKVRQEISPIKKRTTLQHEMKIALRKKACKRWVSHPRERSSGRGERRVTPSTRHGSGKVTTPPSHQNKSSTRYSQNELVLWIPKWHFKQMKYMLIIVGNPLSRALTNLHIQDA